jgi:hypothetical protein
MAESAASDMMDSTVVSGNNNEKTFQVKQLIRDLIPLGQCTHPFTIESFHRLAIVISPNVLTVLQNHTLAMPITSDDSNTATDTSVAATIDLVHLAIAYLQSSAHQLRCVVNFSSAAAVDPTTKIFSSNVTDAKILEFFRVVLPVCCFVLDVCSDLRVCVSFSLAFF